MTKTARGAAEEGCTSTPGALAAAAASEPAFPFSLTPEELGFVISFEEEALHDLVASR